MSKYFLRFFIYLVLFTMLAGIVAVFLLNIVVLFVSVFPYLIAMILVFFKFIRNEQCVSTQMECNRFCFIFVFIFFLYNYIFAIFGPLIFNFSQPCIFELWQIFVS